jgi:hypothetical protein
METVALQRDACEALGLDEEGLSTLAALCEKRPPLAYYEATATATHVLLDVYLTRRALSLAAADNSPPPTSQLLKLLRRSMELFYPGLLPEISRWHPSAAQGEGRAAFDPARLYACLEEYKAARLVHR